MVAALDESSILVVVFTAALSEALTETGYRRLVRRRIRGFKWAQSDYMEA